MATPQTQAIQVANSLTSCAQQLMSVYVTMNQLDAQWSDDAVATTLAAMSTSALNADGSLGATDGTPNSAHPINLTGLSRSLSSTQYAQIKTILDAFVSLVNGNAVSAQTGARGILNFAVGG